MTLLTVRQAASRLGVGYSTLKHWIYEGRVRTRVTSGGHHRIADAEVDRLLAPGDRRPAAPRRARAHRPDRRDQRPQPAARLRRRGPRRRAARAGAPAHRRPDADRGDHPRRGRGAQAAARRRGAGDRQVDRGDDRARGGRRRRTPPHRGSPRPPRAVDTPNRDRILWRFRCSRSTITRATISTTATGRREQRDSVGTRTKN